MIHPDVTASHREGCSELDTDRYGRLRYCWRKRVTDSEHCQRHDDAAREEWDEDWFASA